MNWEKEGGKCPQPIKIEILESRDNVHITQEKLECSNTKQPPWPPNPKSSLSFPI